MVLLVENPKVSCQQDIETASHEAKKISIGDATPTHGLCRFHLVADLESAKVDINVLVKEYPH